MSSVTSSELGDFHSFISQQLGVVGSNLSPEECLAMWRAQHPTQADVEQCVASVRIALQQAERGEGKSLAQFDDEFRLRHGITELKLTP